MNKTLACCYTRFSTEQQNQSSTIGQLKAIQAYCKKNNLELIETYIDEAQSGSNMNRTNFQRMMNDAPTALWEVVVVYNMSRLSRSVKDSLVIKDELNKLGKKVLSVIEKQDDTPEGDFFNLITYGMNELFLKQFKRDSWRGLLVNANDCKAQGGIPPLGYSVGKDKKYIINEEEAKAVRIIFDMTLQGCSYREIATYLNENGYTNRGKAFRIYFTDTLRNEKYAGVYIWNLRESRENIRKKTNRLHKPLEEVIRIEGGMPQIIDRDTFDKVQKILDGRKLHYKRRGAKSKYNLSKLLVCGNCNHSVGGGYTWSGSTKTFRKYYKCINKECHEKDINMDYLDKYINDLIKKVLLKNESADVYKRFITEYFDVRSKKIKNRLDAIYKQKEALRKELQEMVEELDGAQDELYINITKQIGRNAIQKSELDIKEKQLRETLESSVSLNKDVIINKLTKLRLFAKNAALKDLAERVIYKIKVDNNSIIVYVDLSQIFGISIDRVLLVVEEDRDNIALPNNHQLINLTIEHLKECANRQLKVMNS